MNALRLTVTRSIFSMLSLMLLPAFSFSQQSQNASTPISAHSIPTPAESSKPFHEDWSTPILDRSALPMVPPVLAETDDIPHTGFIRERYMVNWRPKDPFDLYVIRPRGVAKPPVILTLYSFPDDTENFKNSAWCETAVKNGYAVVGFVSAVTGHRIRFRSTKEWFVSDMQESLSTTVHDVQLILDYLATRPDVDVTRVGMFGVGSGASVAILASAVDPRIVALDLLGPWGDWPEWLAESKILRDDERTSYLQPDFLSKVSPLDPVAWLAKSKAKSLRIQDVRHNVSMPDKSQERLEAAAPPFAIINQYGNGRAFLNTQPSIALFDWMKDQLKSGTKPQLAADKSQRIHFFPAVQDSTPNWPNVGRLDTSKPQSPSIEKNKSGEEHP